MNIYLVNRYSKLKGPFDIVDSNREQIIKVGDICLRDYVEGLVFLYVNSTNNNWDSCLRVGVGRNDTLTDLNNSLLFSFDGLHKRKGNISLIKELLPCFREKVIFDFLSTAIDILEYKKDSWDFNYLLQFLSPTKELIVQPEINKTEAAPKVVETTTKPASRIVAEIEVGEDSPYLDSPTKIKEIQKLFKRYHQGDKKAYEQIVKENVKLVASIAHSYIDHGVEYADLMQEGMIGLIRAIERFDTSRKVPFSLYAKWWIIQAITQSLQTLPFTVKLPQTQLTLYKKVKRSIDRYEQEHEYEPSISELDIEEDVDPDNLAYLSSLPDNLLKLTSSLVDWEDYPSDSSADELLLKESQIHFVNTILGTLKKKEAYILRVAYGIGEKCEPLSVIADRLGLTRERVRQISEKAVRKLRDLLNVKRAKKEDIEEDEFEDNTCDELVETPKKKEIKQKVEKKERAQKKQKKDDSSIPTHSVFQYKQYRIENSGLGCEIRDFNNYLVYNSPGKVKPLDGALYCISYYPTFMVIYMLVKSGQDFVRGKDVIRASSYTPLYKALDQYRYVDQIDSIRRDFIKKEHKVLVDGKWYDASGYLLTDEKREITTTPKIEVVPQDQKRPVEDAEVGYVIKYDSKTCTVTEKKEGRLLVQYENGTIDNVKNDNDRYEIISKSAPQPEVVEDKRKAEEDVQDDLEIEHVYVDIAPDSPYTVYVVNTSEDEEEEVEIDTNKIEKIFDNKSTSYKYFWFVSIISLAKENDTLELTYKDIVIRMAALAWPIVLGDGIDLGKQDMIAKCLKEIKKKTYLFDDISTGIVESYLRENYWNKGIDKILSPLLNNVPYRFLSPWIKYTSDNDVVNKSRDIENQAFYALYGDCIVINKDWWEFIKENYYDISNFALQSFISYTKHYNDNIKLLRLMTLGWSI